MRSGLLVLWIAVILLGVLLWTRGSAPRASAPHPGPPAESSAASRSESPEAEVLEAPPTTEGLETPAAGLPARSKAIEGESFPAIVDFGSATRPAAAVPLTALESEMFGRKYAERSREERRRARESLEALRRAQASGAEPTSVATTSEDAAAIDREILWLAENPGD